MASLGLADVSFLTGISAPALSRYSSGAKRASDSTARRISEASAVPADSVLLRARVPGFPRLAIAFNDDRLSPVERIAEMSRTFQQAGELDLAEDEFIAYHGRPPRIADPGWEALLHGVAEMSWRRRHPERDLWWVRPSRLKGWWTPVPVTPRRFHSAFLESPAPLLERRVVIPRGDLEAV